MGQEERMTEEPRLGFSDLVPIRKMGGDSEHPPYFFPALFLIHWFTQPRIRGVLPVLLSYH